MTLRWPRKEARNLLIPTFTLPGKRMQCWESCFCSAYGMIVWILGCKIFVSKPLAVRGTRASVLKWGHWRVQCSIHGSLLHESHTFSPSFEFWNPFSFRILVASFPKVDVQEEEKWGQWPLPLHLALRPQLHSSFPSFIIHSRFPFACLGELPGGTTQILISQSLRLFSGCDYYTCLLITSSGIKRQLCESVGWKWYFSPSPW